MGAVGVVTIGVEAPWWAQGGVGADPSSPRRGALGVVAVAVAHPGLLGAERGAGAGGGGAALRLRGARHPPALRALHPLLAAPPASGPRPRPGKPRPVVPHPA